MAESCCLPLSDSISADVFFVVVFFCQKNKTVLFVKSFFSEFSSSDHLNVITTNINVYFDYILAKLVVKMVFIKQYYDYVHAC